MPLFNYKCNACGKSFEELVASSSEKVSCPSCNSEDTLKQLPSKLGCCGTGGSHSHAGACGGG
jgi:putative FmdB family regulatory protein